ncbi:putative rhodanese Homology domain containing protein [Lyophyllum shimeji]|uniref:M-phase inducer phosphatase n=1 Tax=Lyophyllum shimeji TaxID=47721 RepID=A0A9P3PG91_LYOSH|nr:putative rhodanese Homology domain containing protein [Lyophyllum shimeji]
MSFVDRLIDSRQPFKKHKSNRHPDFAFEMSFFAPTSSSQHLKPPSAPTGKRSLRSMHRQEVDEFLSSDLEASFASTVSLNSPPREPLVLNSDEGYAEPMDISPAPPPKPSVKQGARPRAFTSAARLFGNDISNGPTLSPSLAPAPTLKSSQGSVVSKKIQRAALPTEWLMTARSPEPPKSAPPAEVASPADDAMDVDTSFVADRPAAAMYSFSPAPASAAPTVTGFNNLFFETMSPRRSLDSPAAPQPKKRRSLSPEPVRSFEPETSSPMQPSPSQSKMERLSANTLFSRLSKPTLGGLGVPSSSLPKRPRRPALSTMVAPSDAPPVQSAFPVLASAEVTEAELSPKGAPPVRRAFSALIPQSNLLDGLSDESSFDGPDMSSPAQAYAKRQQVKTIRRCDGTEDFRPLTGATAMVNKESPSSRYFAAGMPGFGDNEAHGKILPCHRVREDGLMRISVQTLNDLLDGKYESQIVDHHIIDCRFDYEYAGGHIPGAVNINTTAAVEELLLGPSLTKPRPSTSGDSVKKTILVFHCEFSAKRAPTFAKHLRAKDRAMNNHVYPKIHFPEVYILEGGYCQYFKSCPERCEPQAYVTMDDPTHAASRREDLDQFRKARFGRHKSYAYGDALSKMTSASQQQKRNTAPSGGPNQVFAAANAARTRRGGALTTLPEDGNTTADADDTDTDLGDSPCPPPTKAGALKAKRLGRAPLARAETYNPARMVY